MEEHQARQATEERSTTRMMLCIWIVEMAFVSFFGARRLAFRNSCDTMTPLSLSSAFALNYIIPAWFLISAFGSLIVGKAASAKESIAGGLQRIQSWYKAAPTITFIAFGFLLWTTYNVSLRYHVQLDYQDDYSDTDVSMVRTVTDSLTGHKTTTIIPGDLCMEQEEAGNQRDQ